MNRAAACVRSVMVARCTHVTEVAAHVVMFGAGVAGGYLLSSWHFAGVWRQLRSLQQRVYVLEQQTGPVSATFKPPLTR